MNFVKHNNKMIIEDIEPTPVFEDIEPTPVFDLIYTLKETPILTEKSIRLTF